MTEDKSGEQDLAAQLPGVSDEGELFAASYAELRRLAQRELRRFPGLGVSPTTLVHEAYVNLAERAEIAFAERARFLSGQAGVVLRDGLDRCIR